VQHGKRRGRNPPQRGEVIEIGHKGYDALRAELRHFIGAARESVDTRPAAQHRGGAQRDVTASDQQNPDHTFRPKWSRHTIARTTKGNGVPDYHKAQ
jgi:hypothetical protein